MHFILQNACAADAMRAPPCNNETQTPCLPRLEASNLLVLPRRSCGEQPSVFPASVYHDVTCIPVPGSRCTVAAPHAEGRQHEVPRVGTELRSCDTCVSCVVSVFPFSKPSNAAGSLSHKVSSASAECTPTPHPPPPPPPLLFSSAAESLDLCSHNRPQRKLLKESEQH